MSLIKCPECLATISSQAKSCPHCGYRLVSNNVVEATAVTYDVMVMDYQYGKKDTAKKLMMVLDCSEFDALNLLGKCPAYLLVDVDLEYGEYICQQLQIIGIRTALCDSLGGISYYMPANYRVALPITRNLVRKPYLLSRPMVKPWIEPIEIKTEPKPQPIIDPVKTRRDFSNNHNHTFQDREKRGDFQSKRFDRKPRQESDDTERKSFDGEKTGEKRFSRERRFDRNRSSERSSNRGFSRSNGPRSNRFRDKKFEK